MNHGPGTIDKIVVNGITKWQDLTFDKYCKVVVGDYIEIDGKVLFKAGKKDKFYLTTIKTHSSRNTF